MTASTPTKKKENVLLKAVGDLVILLLLLGAAGFGGYFWGTHQQLAPILKVPPGTLGAVLPPPATTSASSVAAHSADSDSDTAAAQPHSKRKYWLTSSGTDYMGYSITAKVNGNVVDNFFGPGKTIDVTRFVKSGTNTVDLDAKELGDDYNKHKGDAAAALTLHLVSGPSVSESYKPADVLATYRKTAADSGDSNVTLHFSGD